ncbi:MAG: FecR domain-containing protein [Dongiaceae bacterium]
MVKNHRASASRRAWPQAVLFVAFCLVVLSPALVGARAQDLAALPAPWIVAEAVAPVEVRHDRGRWEPLAAGATIAAASEIRTGRDGRVLLVRGADRVQLFARSYLELPPAQEDGAMTRFVQWLGQALFEVEPRPSPRFEVETPYLVATVKGTVFAVEVSQDGAAVAVTAGTVAVATPGGAAAAVSAGRTARAYAGLAGLILEDTEAPAGQPPPQPDADHAWPTPSFDPIADTR